MSSLAVVQDFLAHKRLAVVGVSREPKDFSRMLFRELQARGYDAIPVNPQADEVEGQPCFAHLCNVQPAVDSVLLMTTPPTTDDVVRECVDLGVRRVWMYRAGGDGAVSSEAVKLCESHGIAVVPGECPFMFLAGANWFHRCHGFIRKITGKYPN